MTNEDGPVQHPRGKFGKPGPYRGAFSEGVRGLSWLCLKAAGWQVLRFTGRQIREGLTDYCMPKITETINRLDGLKEEGLVPRTFHQAAGCTAQQLSLFEGDVWYDVDTGSERS